MKKLIATFLAVIHLLGFAHADSNSIFDPVNTLLEWLQRTVMSDEEAAELVTAEFVRVIATRDISLLRAIIHPDALAQLPDFDASADALFDYINGDIVSVKINSNAAYSGHIEHGTISQTITKLPFTLTTTSGTYHFVCNVTYRNDFSPEAVGFHSIDVHDITDKDMSKYYYRSAAPDLPGIHIGMNEYFHPDREDISALEPGVTALAQLKAWDIDLITHKRGGSIYTIHKWYDMPEEGPWTLNDGVILRFDPDDSGDYILAELIEGDLILTYAELYSIRPGVTDWFDVLLMDLHTDSLDNIYTLEDGKTVRITFEHAEKFIESKVKTVTQSEQ